MQKLSVFVLAIAMCGILMVGVEVARANTERLYSQLSHTNEIQLNQNYGNFTQEFGSGLVGHIDEICVYGYEDNPDTDGLQLQLKENGSVIWQPYRYLNNFPAAEICYSANIDLNPDNSYSLRFDWYFGRSTVRFYTDGTTAYYSLNRINPNTIPPAITITIPTATNYIINQVVLANYSCTDSGSGVASCIGNVPNGNPIDTSSVGIKSFMVAATDVAGNPPALSEISYNVVYNFGGFLQPIPLPVSTFKAGSTIPVKFRLTDYAGNSIGTAIANVSVNDGPSLGQAKYDATAGQYIFDLKTKSMPTGPLKITVILDDGMHYDVTVTIK